MKRLFTKTLAMLIAVMLVISAMPVVFAQGDIASGTAGEGVNWVLGADGTLTISGEGEIEVEWYSPPWYDYNDQILNIVINEGITTIPSTAFCYAEDVLSLSIPSSVTLVEEHIFWGNGHSLNQINVAADNQHYTSDDGILFNKDITELVVFPMAKDVSTYTIPETVVTLKEYSFAFNETLEEVIISNNVTLIGDNCFYHANINTITLGNKIETIPFSCFDNTELEAIIIPDNVEVIEGSAFFNCSDLKTLILGSGVISIGKDAFYECYNLAAIHYTGTQQQFDAIEVVATENEDDQYFANAQLHFYDAENIKQAVEPTCTTDGHTAGVYCDDCNDYLTGKVTDEALGHDFVGSVCQRANCGIVCEHINDEFDNKCDECGKTLELNLPYIKFDKTESITIAQGASNYFKFVPSVSEKYVIFSESTQEDVDPYVAIFDSNFNGIEYADDYNGYDFYLEFDAVAGEEYYIRLCAYNGETVEFNYTLEKCITIGHQPTAVEPYVKPTWDDDANYQWYTLDLAANEITDQNANTVIRDWGESSYDAQNGWSGVPYSGLDSEEYDFFTVSLQAGDIVTVEIEGEYFDGVGLWNYDLNDVIWEEYDSDGCYDLMVDEAGDYTLYAYSDSGDLTVRAYISEKTKLEDENGWYVSNYKIQTAYVCEVTFSDGHTEISDLVQIADLPIIIEATAVYNVELADSNETTQDVIIRDKNGEEVLYNQSKQGWPLVAGAGYTVSVGEETNDLIITKINDKLFPDTSSGGWYYDAVHYVAAAGIMKGNDNGTFGTTDNLQRQDFIVMLARLDGIDETDFDYESSLADVRDGSYYKASVNWALELGITNGYTDGPNAGKFGVGDFITREQIVTFIYRYAVNNGVDTMVSDDAEAIFAAKYDDFGRVSDFAKEAIIWALDRGVIKGMDATTINPQGNASRAQIAQIMYNIYQNYIL